MATWGGKRKGSGRPKGVKSKTDLKKRDIQVKAAELGLTPLEYLLKVMNDPDVESGRRDRAAIAAARYVHKLGDRNSTEEKEAKAKKAASGKFRQSNAPLSVVK